MDKSQLLLENKDLPRTKNDRFSVGMKNFSLLGLGVITFFAILFSILSIWQMVLICGICIVFWMGTLLANRQGMTQLSFLAGIITTLFFSLVTTWLLGWNSGFYLISLWIVPVIFHNTFLKTVFKGTLTITVFAVIAGFYILSWQQSSFWVMDEGFLGLFFIINLLVTIVGLAFIGYLCERVATDAENALINTNKKLTGLATTDPVTNLVNRRIILSRIEQEKNRMERGSKPFTLIMVDVDNFKQVNDIYGHNGGDYVLVNLAEIISLSLRKQDEVARWGGDEFLIMLPETDLEGGQIVAEKIRSRILSTPFEYRETAIPVTVTLGVGTSDVGIGVGSCIRKADQALYFGKQSGKNRVGIIQ